MTDEEIMFASLFAPIKAKIQDKNRYIAELEKENRQLKCDLYNTSANLERITVECENLQKGNAELKTELFQKSDTNHSLVEQLADKEIIISELKAQIDKMKCCGNCKHEQDSNTNYYCENCKRFANETDVDKWELAE